MAGRRKKGTDKDAWVHSKIKWTTEEHRLAKVGAAITELSINDFVREAVVFYANKKVGDSEFCKELLKGLKSLYIVKDDDGGIHGPFENREDAEYVADQVHGIVHDTCPG